MGDRNSRIIDLLGKSSVNKRVLELKTRKMMGTFKKYEGRLCGVEWSGEHGKN